MKKTVITNPIIWADVPDVSVIRVDHVFYMVSTSMHSMPGCPIMRSVNLKDWEIVNYVFDTLEDNDAHNLLDGKGIYGKGSWAANLRYHKGTFYVCFSCNDMNRFYVYTTQDIEKGPWQRHVVAELFHDPSLLFDDDRVYVIYGNGDIRIRELTADGTKLKPGGLDERILETPREGIGLRCEGCHAYKINGYYYLIFIEWPRTGNARRRVVGYRSRHLLGPYERKILLDDDMGYYNQGIAQGGLVDTPAGDWYAVLFQDHGAVGRIPYVVPVKWEDGWPQYGMNGKVPPSFEVALPESKAAPLVVSDEFDYDRNQLVLQWQWNHNPDHRLWSVTERPGHLRLKTGHLVKNVEQARNTLTQRTEGPTCRAEVLLDTSHMKPGDYAGLVALQYYYGTVGVEMDDRGERYVVMCTRGEDGEQRAVARVPYSQAEVRLKIDFDFRDRTDTAQFFYSADGEKWEKIGEPLQLKYTLHHFMGCRIGLFYYATQHTGGHVDFDYFRYEKGS
jgi:beta-xylosidase